MSAKGLGENRQSLSGRTRVARLGAATAVLAVIITGITAPSANALLNPGDWIAEAQLGANIQTPSAKGVAVDKVTKDVYVADSNLNLLYRFNDDGQLLNTRVVSEATHVAVDKDSNVYVVSTADQLVQKFDKNLKLLTAWGGGGSGDGQFSGPGGIAVSNGGDVYVADTFNHRVQKFTSGGIHIATFGSLGNQPGELSMPSDLAVARNGDVYVAERVNDRVQVFNSQGTSVRTFGSSGSGPEQFNAPNGIDIDGVGNVYVADSSNNRFLKLTSQGAFISSKQVDGIADLSLNPTSGRVYAAFGDGVSRFRAATKPAISAGPVATGAAGKAYSSKLQATGFPAVTGFTIASGQLPPGLKLATTGTISGVPTKAGSFSAVLLAQNGVFNFPVPTKAYTITIAKASAKVSAKFSTRYPKVANTNIRARIKISAPNTTGLNKSGKVRVYYGKKRVKTYSIKSASGSAKVTLPKFKKKGKTKVTLRYLGNGALKSAKRTIYVRVR